MILPSLEEKKQQLNDLRNFYKPIRKEELDEFEKEYQEKRRLKFDQKRIEWEKYYTEIGYGVYDRNKYKTKFTE